MLYIHLTDGTKLPITREECDHILADAEGQDANGLMFHFGKSTIAIRHVVGFIETDDTNIEKPVRKILPCGGYLFLSRNGKHKHILSLPDHPHYAENCPKP